MDHLRLHVNNKKIVFFTLFIAVSYFIGIFSLSHLLPSHRDFLPNLQSAVFAIVAIILWFYKSKAIEQIGLSSIVYLYLTALLILQPLINQIFYPDSLLFVIVEMTLALFISLAIVNMTDREKNTLSIGVTYMLLIGAIITSLIILLQFFSKDGYMFGLVMPTKDRYYGNVAQPNQAAFILAIGLLVAQYLLLKIKYWYLLLSALFILAIAMTASRGGLILAIFALVVFPLLFNQSKVKKLKNITINILFFSLIYFLSIFAMESPEVSRSSNAIQRFSQEGLSLRIYQFEQAWILFKENIVTGVGWGNYSVASIDKATVLPWFDYGTNSHFLLSQVGSELGVLGLVIFIPLLYLLLKNFSFQMTETKVVIYSVVLLTLLYSMSEYPLWFMRYFIVFIVCLSLIETSVYKVAIKQRCHSLIALFSFILLIGSVYYYLQYQIYSKAAYALNSNMSVVDKKEIYTKLPKVFGFSAYRESFLYGFLDYDSLGLNGKVGLGERTMSYYFSQDILVKQGIYYTLVSDRSNSLQMFQAACVQDFSKKCNDVTNTLNYLYQQNPKSFKTVYDDYKFWLNQR